MINENISISLEFQLDDLWKHFRIIRISASDDLWKHFYFIRVSAWDEWSPPMTTIWLHLLAIIVSGIESNNFLCIFLRRNIDPKNDTVGTSLREDRQKVARLGFHLHLHLHPFLRDGINCVYLFNVQCWIKLNDNSMRAVAPASVSRQSALSFSIARLDYRLV